MTTTATFPHITHDHDGTYDMAFMHQIVSNEIASVDYEARNEFVNGVEHLQITRTVIKKARNRKDRIILWEEIVLSIPGVKGADLVRDIASTLWTSTS